MLGFPGTFRLNATVPAEALRQAGLPRRADAPEAGGYGVQPAFPLSPPEVGAYVVWNSAGDLESEAFDHLEASELEHASVLHMGRVLHAMAEAMVEILRSAGFEAPNERRRPGSGHGRGPSNWPPSRSGMS